MNERKSEQNKYTHFVVINVIITFNLHILYLLIFIMVSFPLNILIPGMDDVMQKSVEPHLLKMKMNVIIAIEIDIYFHSDSRRQPIKKWRIYFIENISLPSRCLVITNSKSNAVFHYLIISCCQ